MHNLLSASLLALVSYVAAAPAAAPEPLPLPGPGKGTFTVPQVSKGKVFVNGAIKGLQTYRKFGAAPPKSLVEAAAAAQSGIVTASPEQYDTEYICQVTVGTGTLGLDFDSGSSDLWVFSSLQPASQRSGHAYYTPGSGAVRESGETWDIEYQDGSGASGVVYADKVVVGGVTATSQDVEAATSVSSQFQQDTQNDGLLGLAFNSINTCSPRQCRTFFNTVSSSLASPVFTANLRKGQAGSYTFGFINSAYYTGSIYYTPVDSSQGFWGFTAGGYSVGTSTSTSGSIGKSIADTGTTLLYLPSSVVSSYYSHVSGASNSATYGGWVFPCSATLPNFNVAIAGHVFTVPGSYINFAPANNAGTVCFGGIQSNTGIGMSIFGDIFLKAVYVVFQPNVPQIGFAAH